MAGTSNRLVWKSLWLQFGTSFFVCRESTFGRRKRRERERERKGEMERGVRDRESERETGREKARAREGEKVELIINSLSIVFQSFLFFTAFASKLKKNSQIFEFLS